LYDRSYSSECLRRQRQDYAFADQRTAQGLTEGDVYWASLVTVYIC